MERLTYRDELGISIDKNEDCPTCSICWNCDIPPRKCNYLNDSLEKLADYEDAEEQGLLLRTKCRLGDVVYALWSVPTESKYVVYPAEVKEINLSSTNARKMIMYKLEPIAFRGRYNKYYDDDFGKLVFQSQEEAEQALAEGK